MNEFNVVIPSRLDSKRLPKKALAMINGKPLIRWVYEKAIASDAKIVLIATDSEEIASIAESFGADVEMTRWITSRALIEFSRFAKIAIGVMIRLLLTYKVTTP
ncbi:MAG: hypothetical protein Ct9H90mP13_07860 [Pseudomonadota bacterium]|nr:MAG: hypothetical protein Ct9H90mP13_07860 [Pseudomonadota bacterium]